MVRKYFVQQLGLLLMVSVIIILTNVIGYKMPVRFHYWSSFTECYFSYRSYYK